MKVEKRIAPVEPKVVVKVTEEPEVDNVEPDANQIMTLGDYQVAFTALGNFFNSFRHVFVHEDLEIKARGIAIVNEVFVYIKNPKEFGTYFNRPLHERIDFIKVVNNEEFVLPQPADESCIDKVSISLDTILKWSQKCFQLIEASRYFFGQGNKKLANRILSETQIALFNDQKTPGVLIAVKLTEPELIKVNDMVVEIDKQQKLTRLKAYRQQVIAKEVENQIDLEAARPDIEQNRIIID